MSERTDRLARNEVVFRALNERVRGVTQELALEGVADEPDRAEYVCECADPDCTTRVRVRNEDYELARADPGRFLVAPGHVNVEIEREIMELDGIVIVEKHPGERRIAAASDPRA